MGPRIIVHYKMYNLKSKYRLTIFYYVQLTSVSLLEISDSKADMKRTHIGQLFELSLSGVEINVKSKFGHTFSSGQI